MVGPVQAPGQMGTWWARSGPGPVHSSPVLSHDECDQLDSAWRQAGCRLQIADLQIAECRLIQPYPMQAGCRFADCRFRIPQTLASGGRQAADLQICRQIRHTPWSHGPWWARPTGPMGPNNKYKFWPMGPGPLGPSDRGYFNKYRFWPMGPGPLAPSDRGYLFFIFICGSQIG